MFLGRSEAGPICLSPRDRSYGLLLIGAPGTGKTVLMKRTCRQDIDQGHGVIVIDPMGPLFDDLLSYTCYRKAIGQRVREVIPFCLSEDDWALPYNPFVRRDGEIAVQVNRRVAATLRVWGQQSADETPRLEKWLTALYWVLIECQLTVLEAAWLLNQHQPELRAFLLQGVSSPLIRGKLEQLSRYRTADFLQQTESVENRLMRFLTSTHLSRVFGPGPNALNFRAIMDERKILLVKLQPSKVLAPDQARLAGTLVLNEAFEAALERPTGAAACYGYVDEAAQFVSLEMAEALERLRQKGLHCTLAFQHPGQFREEGVRLYKAFKNVRNKVVFAMPDRQDALELADDLFAGLAEPQLKIMHRRLNHLIEDVRETSTTQSSGKSRATGRSRALSDSRGSTTSRSTGWSKGLGKSVGEGSTQSRTFSRGESSELSESDAQTHSEHQARASGYSETHSGQQSSQRSSAETVYQRRREDWFNAAEEDGRSRTSGQSSSESSGYSRTETGSESFDRGDSTTHSASKSRGTNTSLAWSRGQQRSQERSSSQSWNGARSQANEISASRSRGQSQEHSASESHSKTDQPGTRHHPFWEEDPEHWSLEEQRWRASELLMNQSIGHWFVRTSATASFGSNRQPPAFYIRPKQLLGLTREFYQRHNLTPEQAEQLILERQARLTQEVSAFTRTLAGAPANRSRANSPPAGAAEAARATQSEQPPFWNRAAAGDSQGPGLTAHLTPPPAGRSKPGPRADSESHRKVAELIAEKGAAWSSEENLLEICQRLDELHVPVPDKWPTRADVRARSWSRALANNRRRVVQALSDHIKAAKRQFH